jgi:predicted metal-dependent hydrolase
MLARRYDLPEPATVKFVDNQLTRWGSCTPVDRSIRLSSRLAAFPAWVLDYVIVHELAHLVEFRHNARFHALVARYPKTERAIGFLIAKGLDPSDD